MDKVLTAIVIICVGLVAFSAVRLGQNLITDGSEILMWSLLTVVNVCNTVFYYLLRMAYRL